MLTVGVLACPRETSCLRGAVPRLGERLFAAVISKLTEQWKTKQGAFVQPNLREVDYMYPRSNGIHVNIRLGEHQSACW